MTSISVPSLDNIVVAMPCYNSQTTIGQTLENVLDQTHKEFRVVVYDDGSTDASPDIVRSFEKRDSRVLLHRNEVNQGRPQARNALLDLAQNAILAWQDADDLWHPTKLAKQVSFYEKMYHQCGHDKIALVSSLERCRPKGEIDNDHHYLSQVLSQGYYGELHPPQIYDVNFICSDKYMSFPFYLQSTFSRASHFIEAGGFDPELPWYEDLDMGIKLLGIGTKIFGLKNEVALAYYFSGAPRLAPDIVTACLKRIYSNNKDFISASGIDVQYDLTLRKLTLLFLGMIRKREFSTALEILAQNSAFALNRSELKELLMANVEVLQKALRASESVESYRHQPPGQALA
ncbi:glycosyltransferase family 2 protein [Neorhizobium alkalisoli]|uniref:glycosyltransferase family 2 protein n=1 Tax=Neorhizobium alkalisoli TaxID=528178 RepID=UPI001319FE0E|nr:glycosyltransferase family 2 protein [Neorhizobium alkalisoli]